MSSFIVYSCHCCNIKIHLSTKYTKEDFEQLKNEAAVQTPVSGWEFELGMGGVVTEFVSITRSKSVESDWKTFECLNCNSGNLYSIPNSTSSNKVVIHENAIYGEEIDKLKQEPTYSHIFNIKLSNDIEEDLIPMPSVEDVPGKLVSTHNQIQNLMDQSAEKLRLESKARIEEFKQQEEKRVQDLLSKAKSENTQLWSKIIRVTSEQSDDKKEKSHVRFAPVEDTDPITSHPTIRKSNFDLNESAISSSLKNKNLDHISSNFKYLGEGQQSDEEEEEEEEEEDMFNLDEEFSDEEKENGKVDESKENSDNEESKEDKSAVSSSSSLKKSISESDQKFSWIKKKRNTSKYLTQDFDIKSDFKRDSKTEGDPSAISLYATSVPISIHYPDPLADDEKEEEKNDNGETKSRKKDLLASSFANIDFSYSDRMLSEQFPAPRRRKSLASTSLINPQLDSLVGKSLDTRGLMKKKKNEVERKDDREEFDSSLPPHVWAAMESIDE